MLSPLLYRVCGAGMTIRGNCVRSERTVWEGQTFCRGWSGGGGGDCIYILPPTVRGGGARLGGDQLKYDRSES